MLKKSWNILKCREKDGSSSSSSSSQAPRANEAAATGGAKLNKFLEAQFDSVGNTEEFDPLLWQKNYSYRYLIMSHLARDVLIIPVSTISSEQAFSTSGRIIEPKRNSLSFEMVEVLGACSKEDAK
ncbi:hypothetical protein Ddye_000239 [Dipteronia dyeriana]|uniref:HAT C-terminal dimerisation domain-containing protein n=1 Tax=Dipteronia dyeriana TaxID=168575 RepID=A0AAD9XLJ5_9ROSI|nr:hypothetical protein Ddye_000239 [Dipteronia dyeriana]